MAHTPESTHIRHVRRDDVVNPATSQVDGAIAALETVYFDLGGQEDLVMSVHLRYMSDATAGTFTLESTNLPPSEASATSIDARDWAVEADATAEIENPAGIEKSVMLHLGNGGSKRYRLKYVASDVSELDIICYGVH